MRRKHDIMIRSMNPNQPQQQNNSPGGSDNNVRVNDIYPANPSAPPPSSPYLPVSRVPSAQSAPPPYTAAPKKDHSSLRGIISTILLLAIAPLIAFGITSYAIQSYQVDGESMETTLQNGDRLIVDKMPRTISRVTGHAYVPHRGDIIIFNQANLPDTSFGQTKQLIKRVVGKDGKVTVYNDANPQGFNPDTSTGYKITAATTPGEADVVLGKDQIFVCGDNRPNSEDSRYFGPINANDIVGKLSLRLLPINKAEKF
jgi:signal peptidase I